MIRSLLPVLLPAMLLAACAEPRFFEQENPQRLSDWNLFRDDGSRFIPREQTLVFAPANPLFTDYAGKLRTMWLPAGEQASLADGELEFPAGSILSKTFFYPTGDDGLLLESVDRENELDRARHRMIETRLLVRREDGWHAMAYVWNEEQTEAFLRVAGASVPASLRRESGVTEFVYFVPNENQCAGCHVTVHPDGPLHPLGAVAGQLADRGCESRWRKPVPIAGDAGTGLARCSARPAPGGFLGRRPGRSRIPGPGLHEYPLRPLPQSRRRGGHLGTGARRHHRNPLELGVCKTPVAAGGGAGDPPVQHSPRRAGTLDPALSHGILRARRNDAGTRPFTGARRRHRADPRLDRCHGRRLSRTCAGVRERVNAMSRRLIGLCLLLICLIAAGCSDRQFERRTYVLTTGTTGGTFYPVGVALSTIVSARQDESFSLTAISPPAPWKTSSCCATTRRNSA